MHLVRKLENMQVWDPELQPQNSINADALRNVRTQKNQLSFFCLESIENLVELATAVSIKGDHAIDVVCCIFDENVLRNCGFNFKSTPGDTGIPHINALHYDLNDLTGHSVVKLTAELIANGEIEVVSKSQVIDQAGQFLRSGRIDSRAITEKLKNKWKVNA